MKLLVTGATGFVGYNFVKHGISKGYDITCLVRLSSNTEHLRQLNTKIFTADLSNLKALSDCLFELKPDVVVHCAGCVVANQEQQFIDANVEFTKNICQASLEQGIKRLVYLSTVDVNSANENLPITEDMPYIASNTYGQTKINAEKVVLEFRKLGLTSVILRPTTIIGEDEPHGINQLLPLLLKRRIPLPGLTPLKDKIHIVYIGNVVQAIELALTKEKANQETFNICDQETTSIRTMMRIMTEELNCKPPRVIPSSIVKLLLLIPSLKKTFNGIFKNWEYDISKAEELLNYKPLVSSEEGMRKTVRKWIENQKE